MSAFWLLGNAMATLVERALLAAVRHVAESGATWPSAEVRQAWCRVTMTNRGLACRISSDCIRQWYYTRLRQVLVDVSAGDSDEPWYDSEDNGYDTESSSRSSGSTWYDRKTGLMRF